MIKIPTEYKKDCVDVRTTYGKFLKKYNHKKRAKNNKLEDHFKAIKVSQMSKYEFIKEYILKYDIYDLLYIKDPSLKGFIYEALWDICFKLNIIDEYDNTKVQHIDGKIEDLRIKKDIIDLTVINNIYQYLKDNKVQSGNSAGISDITMKYYDKKYKIIPCKDYKKDIKNKYIFVSSKFYINEKAITSYDVASITQAVKDTNIDYEIVLVVNDKVSLQRSMERTLKKYTLEKIAKVYDINDLNLYINKLKNILNIINYDELMQKNYKKISKRSYIPITNETEIFYNKIITCNKNISWYCFDLKSLIISILYFVLQENKNCNIIAPNNIIDLVNKYKNKYIGLDHIDIYDSNSHIYFIYNDDTFKQKDKRVIYFTNIWKLQYFDIIQKFDSSPLYPKVNYINNSNTQYKSKSFKLYENYFGKNITRKDMHKKSVLKDVIDIIFGNSHTHLEDFIFRNRCFIENVTIIIPDLIEFPKKLNDILTNNDIVKKLYQRDLTNNNFIEITTSKIIECTNTLIILDDKLNNITIYNKIAELVSQNKYDTINIITFFKFEIAK